MLAIDFGTKNIGLAVTDDSGSFSFAFDTLRTDPRKGLKKERLKILADLQKICLIQKIEKVVVGLPTNLEKGDPTQMTKVVFDFVRELEDCLKPSGVTVDTFDERWTTFQASRMANKNSRNIDELSAQILLQDYIDKIDI